MGYRAKKQQREGKIKRIKYILLSVLLLFVGGFCVFAAVYPPPTWKYYFSLPTVSEKGEGELRIHFLDVGQGDCTLIEFPDGQTLLIDGGNTLSTTEKTIMRYLNALKIKKIDYLLVTHTDEDHCGALPTLITYKEIGKIFLPQAENVDVNTAYSKTYAAAIKSGAKTVITSRGMTIQSNDEKYSYTFSVIYPYATVDVISSTTETNINSAVAWLDYLGVSALFTGDMPSVIESQLMSEDANNLLDVYGVDLSSTEILKVAHHGSRYSTSSPFLQYLNVEAATISCGKDNPYGHPHKEVLHALQEKGAEIFRTDEQGTIVATILLDGTYRIE